ncbi:MAG: GreA/GreB family elongation factor [Kofleriaceae bacterium]
MSKAFTRESDDVSETRARRRGLPVPELNFVTPEGLVAARAELDALVRSHGDPDRIRELTEHLATAQPFEPADRNEAGVGATVTVEDEHGKRHSYRIVGAIEADPKRGWIGWQSPIAQVLFGVRAGDLVVLPRGDEVEVVSIRYG